MMECLFYKYDPLMLYAQTVPKKMIVYPQGLDLLLIIIKLDSLL